VAWDGYASTTSMSRRRLHRQLKPPARAATDEPVLRADRRQDPCLQQILINEYAPGAVGSTVRARGFAAQQTEAAIGAAVLIRILVAGRSKSVCREVVLGSHSTIEVPQPQAPKRTNAAFTASDRQ
jgi:hypothetical protein